MKQAIFKLILAIVFTIIILPPQYLTAQASNITFEKLKEQCKGIPREKRVRITVTRFSVSSKAAQATGQFGEELTAIMTNAIQQCNCFRVLESTKDKEIMNDEINYGETGATNGAGAKRGQQLGAQVIVSAEVTEYSDGDNSVQALGIKIGKNKAKIGLIVKVINPQSRDVLWSTSVNGEAKKTGFQGGSFLGLKVAGSSKVSEAMSGAVEDVVLKTIELLVKEREEILSNLPDPMEGLGISKKWNAANCRMLANGTIPKVMVIVPEYHITFRVPDPAGETEILRKFLEAGFRAVDPSMYATLRKGARFSEAVKNPMAAISIGKEFGADIVIFGEGFSERVDAKSNPVTCRARVEVRAVRTDNAEIIATNGAQAGGQDIAESTASKTALKNAGAQISDYLLGQMCEMPKTAGSGNRQGLTSKGVGVVNTTVISLNKTNFSDLSSLANTLKESSTIKDAQKELKGSKGTITLTHEGSSDELAEIINKAVGTQFEITGVENGKISLSKK
jgi:curli biogenesis system outer membrane secretion channel CsgG